LGKTSIYGRLFLKLHPTWRPKYLVQAYLWLSQSSANMGETISEAIAADHASFDEYADYLKTATDDAEKVRWRNQLTWTVGRHALSEELTLYPAMEKHLGDEGVRLTKTDKEQHQAVGNKI
jgi:hemerythrin superfamily protein